MENQGKKRIRPPYFIFKPDNMSGLLFHALIILSIGTCYIILRTLTWSDDGYKWGEELSLLNLFAFFWMALCCFLLAIYNYSFFPRFSKIKRIVFDFFYALVFLVLYWFLLFAMFSISAPDMPIEAKLSVLGILAVFGAIVAVFFSFINGFKRYVKMRGNYEELFSLVDRYILQKYPGEEFLKTEKKYTVCYARKKRIKNVEYVIYDAFSRFANAYEEGRHLPRFTPDGESRWFPKSLSLENCFVNLFFTNLDGLENSQYYFNGEHALLKGFEVYIKDGVLSDNLPAHAEYSRAVNELIPQILEYLTGKYPGVKFEILSIENNTPALPTYREDCLDLSGNIVAIVAFECAEPNVSFFFHVYRIDGEFLDDYDDFLNAYEEDSE
jgi:hypothetical protein